MGRLPVGSGVLARSFWLVFRIAATVTLVVVPFGYAITGAHADVLLGAGYGIAVGAGVGLRGGSGRGRGPASLIGSIVGVAAVLIDGLLPYDGWAFLILPVLALAVGLIDGIGGSSLSGYRDVRRVALTVAILLSLGLCPSVLVSEPFPRASGWRLSRCSSRSCRCPGRRCSSALSATAGRDGAMPGRRGCCSWVRSRFLSP